MGDAHAGEYVVPLPPFPFRSLLCIGITNEDDPELAKPFEPPTNDQVLRYRYTTYLGESHPAQRKVVVTFCPADLGLPAEQELKLKKLAGVRFNPEKDEIKMSCESFDHQAQNKRYLSDQIDKLVETAKVRVSPKSPPSLPTPHAHHTYPVLPPPH